MSVSGTRARGRRAAAVLAAVLTSASCGARDPDTPASPPLEQSGVAGSVPPPAATSPADMGAALGPADPDATASPAIGWAELPAPPPPEALRRSRQALRAHRQGDYAGSERIFREVATAHPGFVVAAFNQACALALLGRKEEAAEILGRLLALDYPSIAPRLEREPDLADVRSSPLWAGLQARRTTLADRWSHALAEGVPVVHGTAVMVRSEGYDWRVHGTAQAGVWLHAPRRFVPMGPRVVSAVLVAGDQGNPIAAAMLDQGRRRVLTVVGMGRLSDSFDVIDRLEVVSWVAGDGTRLDGIRGPNDDAGMEAGSWTGQKHAHATDTGLSLRLDVGDGRRDVTAGARSVFDATTVPMLQIAQEGVIAHLAPPPDGLEVRGRTLRARVGGRDVAIALHNAHAHHGGAYLHRVMVVRTESDAWVMTAEVLDRGSDGLASGPVALSRVDLAAGRARLLRRSPVGPGALMAGADGAVYAQLGSALLRYAVDADEPEALPSELFLIANGL